MFDNVSTYQHFHTIFYDFKIMNGSLTTLSLHVIGDWGLSNVFSFLNIVKQFLVLTCLVLSGSDGKLLSCESRLIFLFYHLWQHSPIINYTAVGPDSHCNNLPSESTFTLDKFTLYYFITSWFIAFLPSLRQAFFVFSTLVRRLASHWINWPQEASLRETYFDRWD